MVVSNALDVERRCAIELVAPGWRVCERANPRLEEAIEFTSIVTYTRGSELGETGTFSRTYGHDDADHIWLPIKRYDGGIAAVNSAFRADVRRALCQEGTHVFRLGAEDMIDDLRGGDDFLITDMNDCFPLRGRRIRDILPFDDESPAAGEKKLAFQGGDRKRFEALKHLVVQSPLEVMGLDARGIAAGAGLANNNSGDGTLDLLDRALDLDRAAALYLSWSRMPLLESLVLDLRIYSHDLNRRRGCLRRREVVERAAKMGRHLRLKLLVIAGLRSYDLDEARYYYDDAGATTAAAAADVESRDRLHGQPNWIKLFLPALRPGGRIVLVDRVGDQAPELPWSLAEIDNFAIVGQLMEQR
ncbi:hypothetical protein F4778DRAFT_757737 [Xylariomycetidae sp. FL2044]|nr:hypothetical protein F4778DRAFT_757737 [Xylariomycetidae sp. FL2044]